MLSFARAGAGKFLEEARRLQHPLSSMDDQKRAQFFKRFGSEIVGPSRVTSSLS
jgi:hypothetical protein